MMGIPAHILIHTVTRVRAATSTDAYNNTVLSWGETASTLAMTAWLQQDDRAEPRSDGRDPLEQRWLLMTNDTDIVGGDRVVFGDLTFEVEGPPEPVYTMNGFHHTEATLRVVTG